MNVLRVRHHDAVVNASFKLRRFVSNWPAGQQSFIDGIRDRFHDWHPVGPGDFSFIPAYSLEDARCKCRLFGGACSIVLAPESLVCSFNNVKAASRPAVLETIRRASEWLSSALADCGVDWLTFDTAAHLQAVEENAADAYLGQFTMEETVAAARLEPGVRCVPSTRVGLEDEGGRWMLSRVVEKSAAVENGVFVHTQVHVRSPDAAGFEEHAKLIDSVEKLADRFVGLECEEG